MISEASSRAEFPVRALRAVLSHPNLRRRWRVDERPIESYLVSVLNAVPQVADALFGCGLGVVFALGTRGQADVVGWAGEDVVVECEVKIYSAVNWSRKYKVWQLDTYVANAPSANFFLLTWDGRKLLEELDSWRDTDKPIRTLDRWQVLRCAEVLEVLDRLVGPTAATDGGVEYAALVATRLEAA